MGGPNSDDTIPWNASHLPGTTVAAVSSVGKAILTAGVDSLVRCVDISKPWYSEPDGDGARPPVPEPVELNPLADFHEHPITSMALSVDGRLLVTGDESSSVRLFELPHDALPLEDPEIEGAVQPEVKLRQLVAKFGGPVRSVAFSPSGRFLAAVSDEPGLIKYVNCSAFNNSVFRSPPNLSEVPTFNFVQFDPYGDFLLTLTKRGVPHLWSIDSQTLEHTIAAGGAIAPTTQSPSSAATAAAWNSDGSLLALGLASGKVLVLQRGSEKAVFQGAPIATLLPPANGRTPVSAVCWAPTGGYVLAGDIDGQTLLWRVDLEKPHSTQEPIEKWNPENEAAAISALSWIPGRNAFAAVDNSGQWGVVGDVVEPHLPAPVEKRVQTRSQPALVEPTTSDTENGHQDDEEEDDVDIRRSVRRTAVDDLDDDESEDNGPSRPLNPYDDDEYDSDRDYYRDLYGSGQKKKRERNQAVPAIAPKPAKFMPSSTPQGQNVTRRMLCWNLTGAMLTNKEETKSTVEVDFADSARRPIRFADHYGYDHGSLSDAGAFFGCPPSENHPSCLFYKPHNPWSTNAEWIIKLGPEENSELVALGKRFAASLTSKNMVRVFSLTGIQTDLFRVAGSPVSMAAAHDKLVIVTALESGQLWYELLKESNSGTMDTKISSGPLPLTSESSLRWIGFSKEANELVTYDSSGAIQCLSDSRRSKRWTILLDNASKVAECDTFWLASVTKVHAIGVGCLGSEKYPSIAPRPAFRSIRLSTPLLEGNTKLEALFSQNTEMWRATAYVDELQARCGPDDDDLLDAQDDVTDLKMSIDKTLLGLMEMACKANQAPRALELFSRLHRPESARVAHKLANHYKMPALLQRMELVMKAKKEEDERKKELEAVRNSPPVSAALPMDVRPGTHSPVTPAPSVPARNLDLATSKESDGFKAPKSGVRFDLAAPQPSAPVGRSEEAEASDSLDEILPQKPTVDKMRKKPQVSTKRELPANPFARKALKRCADDGPAAK